MIGWLTFTVPDLNSCTGSTANDCTDSAGLNGFPTGGGGVGSSGGV